MELITVKHNIEVAHRLFLTEGKCEQIHGHSMMVTLTIYGATNEYGLLSGLEFGAVKADFRAYLDGGYDHRLLLNSKDNWANYKLPGLAAVDGDPTTENLAKWIGQWAQKRFGAPDVRHFECEVQETATNGAKWISP